VGTTWTDYLQALDDQATYLARYGSPTHDVQNLFSAMLGRASGNYLQRTMAWSQDAYSPARGLPLAFTRVALDTLDQRFVVGPLGRSWSHSFEYTLTQPDVSTAIVNSPGGRARTFVKNPSGVWQAAAGDFGVLEQVGGGTYHLREKDGLVWQFDSGGRLVSIAEPNSNSISLTYSISGNLTAITHSNGQTLALEYNAQERISRLTDHAGRETEYLYNTSGEHLLSVVAPGGITTSYTYTSAVGEAADHALQAVAYPDGTHQYHAYDAQGRLAAQWRDGNAERIEFTYDALGTVYAQDAVSGMTTLHLGSLGQLLDLQDPLGNRTRFQYDSDHNLTRLVQPDGATSETRLVQPDGATSEMAYDTLGNAMRVEDALGRAAVMAHTTDLSRLDWLRDARGNLTDFAYDDLGNLTDVAYPNGTDEMFGYDGLGDVITITNRRGDVITLTHDALGQVVRKDYSDGRWITLPTISWGVSRRQATFPAPSHCNTTTEGS
jgi:YD repeat-containing protein